TRFPIPQIREHVYGRLHAENYCGVVREIDVRAEMVGGHVNLNAFHDLALRFWKLRDRSCTLVFSHDVRSVCIVIRGASLLRQWRVSLHTIGACLQGMQGKSYLPKNSAACPKSAGITGVIRQSRLCHFSYY